MVIWTEDHIEAARVQGRKQLKAWAWLLLSILAFGWLAGCAPKYAGAPEPELVRANVQHRVYKLADGTWVVQGGSIDAAQRYARDYCEREEIICALGEPLIFITITPYNTEVHD